MSWSQWTKLNCRLLTEQPVEVSIRLKATALTRDMKINDFQEGLFWCFCFMKRHNLSNETVLNNDKRDLGIFDAKIAQLLISDTEDEEFVEEE